MFLGETGEIAPVRHAVVAVSDTNWVTLGLRVPGLRVQTRPADIRKRVVSVKQTGQTNGTQRETHAL